MQLKKLLFINVLLIGSILLIAGCSSGHSSVKELPTPTILGSVLSREINQASCSIQGLDESGKEVGQSYPVTIDHSSPLQYIAKTVPSTLKLQITCIGGNISGEKGAGQVIFKHEVNRSRIEILMPQINVFSSGNTIGNTEIGSNLNEVEVAFTKNIPFHLSINHVENAPTDVTYAITSDKADVEAIKVTPNVDVYDLFKDVREQTTFTVCMIAQGGDMNDCTAGNAPSIESHILAVSSFRARLLQPPVIGTFGPIKIGYQLPPAPIIDNVSSITPIPTAAKWAATTIGKDYTITLPSSYKKDGIVNFGVKVKNGDGDYVVVSNGTDASVVSTEIQGNDETDVKVDNIKSLIQGITPYSSKHLYICVLDTIPTRGNQCNSGVSLTVSVKPLAEFDKIATAEQQSKYGVEKAPAEAKWEATTVGKAYTITLPSTYQQGEPVNFDVQVKNGGGKYVYIANDTTAVGGDILTQSSVVPVGIIDIERVLQNLDSSSPQTLHMCILEKREESCNAANSLATLTVSVKALKPSIDPAYPNNKIPNTAIWMGNAGDYVIGLPNTYQQGNQVNFVVNITNGDNKYFIISRGTKVESSSIISGNDKHEVRIDDISSLLTNLTPNSKSKPLSMCVLDATSAPADCNDSTKLAELTVVTKEISITGTPSIGTPPFGPPHLPPTLSEALTGYDPKIPTSAVWAGNTGDYAIGLPNTYQQDDPVNFVINITNGDNTYFVISNGTETASSGIISGNNKHEVGIDDISNLLTSLNPTSPSKSLYMCALSAENVPADCNNNTKLAELTVSQNFTVTGIFGQPPIKGPHLPPTLSEALTAYPNKTPSAAVWAGNAGDYTIGLPNTYQQDDPVNFVINITNGDDTYFVISNGTDTESSSIISGNNKQEVGIDDISKLVTNLTPGSSSDPLYMCALSATSAPADCNDSTKLAKLTVSMVSSTQPTGLLAISTEIEEQPSVVNWDAPTIGKAYTITLQSNYQAGDPVNFGVQVGNEGGKYLAISDGRAPSAAKISDTASVVSVNMDDLSKFLQNIDLSSPQTLYICIVENQMDSLQCNAANHQATLTVSMVSSTQQTGLLGISTEIEEQPSVVNWDDPTIGKAYTITLQSNYQAGDPVNFGVQVGNEGGKYLAISDGYAPSAAQISDTASVVSVNMDDLSKFLQNIDLSSPQTLYICIVDTQMDSLQCNATNHQATLTVSMQDPSKQIGLLAISPEIEEQPSAATWVATTVGKAYTITLPSTYQAGDPVNFGVQVGNEGGKYLAISDGSAPSAAQIADTDPVVSVNMDDLGKFLQNLDSSSPQTLYICVVDTQMDSLQCNATNHQATLTIKK